MKNSAKNIYESYLKPREKAYRLTDYKTKFLKTLCEFKNTLTLKQLQMFEELEYLSKQIEHENNIDIIEYSIRYLSKKEEN